jgi:hypothetical protein
MSTLLTPVPRAARFLPVLAAALVLLGLGVRVRHYLAAPSYWYDEAYLLLNVFEKSCAELAGPLRDDQAAPPVFLWALRGLYVAAGASEYVMRLPAFLASLAAVGVMIPVARRIVAGPGWVWAVGLCALSMHGVNHGIDVKPYAWDLLATLLLLLAAERYFARPETRRRYALLLVALAAAAPWCSLPSVFVLGGVSLALFADLCRRPGKAAAAYWLLFNAAGAATAAALWWLVLRHQRTQSLHEYWSEFYGDCSSLPAFLAWLWSCLVGVGNYGSNGLGVPLVLLGVAGAALVARRSPPSAVLLTAPVVLAMAASALHFYPLADRLTFFLVPCVWLLAAEAVGALAAFLLRPDRRAAVACAGAAVLLALLAPGAAQFAKRLVVVTPRLPFREAFGYVEERGVPQDLCWISHPQVFEVYRGKGRPYLSAYAPVAEVARRAAGHRVWVVCAVGPDGPVPFPEMEAALRQAGLTPLEAHDLPSMLVRLYGPAPNDDGATAVHHAEPGGE